MEVVVEKVGAHGLIRGCALEMLNWRAYQMCVTFVCHMCDMLVCHVIVSHV